STGCRPTWRSTVGAPTEFPAGISPPFPTQTLLLLALPGNSPALTLPCFSLPAEEEPNEEDVLGEEIEEEEPKAPEPPVKVEEPPVKSPDVIQEKKVVKISSEISQMERMQKRAERFNVPVSLESKKAARAARFGLATIPTKGLSADSKPTINLEKLKERAQRFGLNVSSLSKKSEEDEKLKKRKERFGIVTGAGAAEDSEVG
uniref:SAP domain containing ribonucleoprotein n=1 Tax=Serinus canaria TaxID=9135 RepID=A0A8C9KUU3_SERCA